MTLDLINAAIDAANEYNLDYDKIGIRIQDEPFDLGPVSHCSHVWIDGDDTGDELDGLCVQDVRTLKTLHNSYFGSHVAIIAGNEYEYGEDPGELIIRDAVCVKILA